MRAVTLLLSLFLSVAALAQFTPRPAHAYPFGPTSTTPVEIHFPTDCFSDRQTVTRVGPVIKVHVLDPQCQVTLPIELMQVVRVPELLPPGEYRIEVTLGDFDGIHAAGDFVVRNGGPKPFEVHPFAVPRFGGGLQVRLYGDQIRCETADCSDVTLRVDGTVVRPLKQARDGAIWFTAPPHAKGLVDVTVQREDFVEISPAALYYYEEAHISVFERVLFPVLFSTGGAQGSQWVSEATLLNPRPWFVENFNTVSRFVCLSYPCGERMSPGQTYVYQHGFPRGAVLLVPRPEAPDFAFGLRVRDTSRQAEGLGTQVPVVRESDMFHGTTISLLDVPVDPRYRIKVRVYALDPLLHPTQYVTLTIRSTTTVRHTFQFQLTRGTADEPYYAEIDLPAGAANERVNIYVRPPVDATGWAFATVTNNETQQVTIVTPNGQGGEPFPFPAGGVQ